MIASTTFERQAVEAVIKPFNPVESVSGSHAYAQFVKIRTVPRAAKYVIPGVIGDGLVNFSGGAGIGKTTTIAPLALTAAGICRQGDPLAPKHWRHVVYVTEDVDQVERVITGLVEFGGMGLDMGSIHERFHLVRAERLDVDVVCEVATVYKAMFTRTVQTKAGPVEVQPLVVFDTRNACFSFEDENSNSEASRIVAALKQRFEGLPVWIVSHVAKSTETVESASTRGAGAWDADVNQTVLLGKSGEKGRGMVVQIARPAKCRFEPRWPRLAIESNIRTVEVADEYGDTVEVGVRWNTLQPLQAVTAESIEEAERQADNELRTAILETVDQAHRAGLPLTKSAIRGKVNRNAQAVGRTVEVLLSENWLFEVPIPSAERRNPNKRSFIVRLDEADRRTLLAGGELPATVLEIPPALKKKVQE